MNARVGLRKCYLLDKEGLGVAESSFGPRIAIIRPSIRASFHDVA